MHDYPFERERVQLVVVGAVGWFHFLGEADHTGQRNQLAVAAAERPPMLKQPLRPPMGVLASDWPTSCIDRPTSATGSRSTLMPVIGLSKLMDCFRNMKLPLCMALPSTSSATSSTCS